MVPPIQQTGNMVKRLQARHHRMANAALADIGVSIVQWDALRHIDERSGASLHELAELTFQSDQSFGALASRLEARGLIERVPTPGRAVRHRLTEAGQRARALGATMLDRVLTESFASLTSVELDQLDTLLRKLLEDEPHPEVHAGEHRDASLRGS